MRPFHGRRHRHNENGQTLPMFAFFLTVIILFVGLAIDFGFAYLTKASLSKAVDAACLAGVRNLSKGQDQAEAIARSAFAVNYTRPATVHVVFGADPATGNTQLSVDATATLNTFFIRILPQWTTLDVNANAQATRANLVMSVVLDRSGSMQNNGGWSALPPALDDFIDLFDDNLDRVAMTSFASSARVDVSLTTNFKSPIKQAVLRNRSDYQGGTFANGGLQKAKQQNESVVVAPGAKDIVKVAVFFTDGMANIIQDTLNCSSNPTLRNFGGYDSGGWVDFFNPSNGVSLCTTDGASDPPCCSGVNKFKSAIDGMYYPFNRQHVTNDAEYQAVQTANAMRAEGTVVYAIGLGNNINKEFLKQIANDPGSSTFDSTQPQGEAVFAPDASDLQQIFQDIASKILLRLTQ